MTKLFLCFCIAALPPGKPAGVHHAVHAKTADAVLIGAAIISAVGWLAIIGPSKSGAGPASSPATK